MTDRLLELENGFWNAAGDAGYYERHMARDGLCVLPVGMMDKRATLSAVSQAEPWKEFEFTDVHILDLGDDEASISYLADASRTDGDRYTALISSVYTRRHGEWKLTLHQQTPLT